ncbi:thioredoxin domain protein [Formosa agariphila KMM 3901]|uniref:Thioredoxin domain protein n=1 Tax=Formosa agariphila (strain DSM 15362 / KCTC 12365 / LMG 23005 / KMM 3901 / M-2Alg 35-1) TaxID=1347342 RepID=T2KN73_FORAG|nr:thioredoxin family protein [Formosa agariphila]CDF80312.1 thioredoxin domain protein [Formosa agariphila KMM 3901]
MGYEIYFRALFILPHDSSLSQMLDFTGWACVNCRKMEQNVWPEPEILNLLSNDVVLISLYVDDKRKLEADEIVDSQLKPGKKLKYIGQKWSEM